MSGTKDAVATMGAILPTEVQLGARDAVHVATLAVRAGHKLYPGQDVGFTHNNKRDADLQGGLERYVSTDTPKPIGIVDPFIRGAVMPDQRFWLFLYPRTITSLSHKWGHPDVPDDMPDLTKVDKESTYATPAMELDSKKWLTSFFRENGLGGYEEGLKLVKKAIDNPGEYVHPADTDYFGISIDGDYFHFSGTDASGDVPPELWEHLENVLHTKIKNRPEYFSCSC